MQRERIHEWGAYRPKDQEEKVNPIHIADINGRLFVPVSIYGPKPSIIDGSNLVPNPAQINPARPK